MKVHLGGLDLFVTQPERDHGAINTVVKQVHGSGIPIHTDPMPPPSH